MKFSKSRLAYIFIVLGFLLRIAYVQFINPIDKMIFSDMANYVSISNQLLNNEWKISHFFQPIGYPLFINIIRIFALRWFDVLEWVQVLSGTMTLIFLWKTVKESLGEDLGIISLAIASIHLPWIGFTGTVLAENLFILLLSILAWLSLRLIRRMEIKTAFSWAIIFFAAFLVKGTHVFLVPMFVLGLFLFKNRPIKIIAIIIVTVSFGLLSHGLFTYTKVGKFQLSASAGGLNFIEGKCPIKNNADSTGISWLSPLYYQLGFTQLQRWDRPFTDSSYFMKEGLKCIANNPFVLIQSFEGIPFLFIGNTLWPLNQTSMSNFMRLYDLIFGFFSIIGLAIYLRFLKYEERAKEEFQIWVLPIISVFLCVYIFKSELRFRIPFDVWIIPVAVKGWIRLLQAKIA